MTNDPTQSPQKSSEDDKVSLENKKPNDRICNFGTYRVWSFGLYWVCYRGINK